jgi:hypothetical protein
MLTDGMVLTARPVDLWLGIACAGCALAVEEVDVRPIDHPDFLHLLT